MEKSIKDLVVEDVIVRITLDGSFQRANIYRKSTVINDSVKTGFRNYLAQHLKQTLTEISARDAYTDEDHYNILQIFSENVGKEYQEILSEGKLRIGTAQKLLNLYWKFSWLLKPDIPKPIHCPFDSIVIAALNIPGNHILWTKMDSIQEYEALVTACKLQIGNLNVENCIADWELKLYSSKNNYNPIKAT